MNNSEVYWRELHDRVRRFVAGRVRDQHLVDDVVQDTMLRVFDRLNSLKSKQKLTSWAVSIARNKIADVFRKPEALVTTYELLENEPVAPQQSLRIDEDLIACAIQALFDSVPEKYRVAVKRVDFEGEKQTDLARELGLSVSAVKSRVQRGRALMRKKFLECCALEFDGRGQVADYHCVNKDSCVVKNLPAVQQEKIIAASDQFV